MAENHTGTPLPEQIKTEVELLSEDLMQTLILESVQDKASSQDSLATLSPVYDLADITCIDDTPWFDCTCLGCEIDAPSQLDHDCLKTYMACIPTDDMWFCPASPPTSPPTSPDTTIDQGELAHLTRTSSSPDKTQTAEVACQTALNNPVSCLPVKTQTSEVACQTNNPVRDQLCSPLPIHPRKRKLAGDPRTCAKQMKKTCLLSGEEED